MNPERKVCEAPTYHSLKEYFDYLRNELAMEVNTRWSVESLSEYIDGYNHALFIHNIDEHHCFSALNPSFNDWVMMKENYHQIIMPWHVVIKEVIQSDQEGIQLFLRYYDGYVAREATVLFDYTISKNDIHYLVCLTGKSDEEKRRYIGCKIQIISYDETKNGVFERWVDENGVDLYDQYILRSSYDDALGAIKSNFRMDFAQNLHRFRIACAWEKDANGFGCC